MAFTDDGSQSIDAAQVGALRLMIRAGISGCQARAARAMLMWSVRTLAANSGISESSIRRIESEFGVPENVSLDLLVRLREFYEERGFQFHFDDDHPGVIWRRREEKRDAESKS